MCAGTATTVLGRYRPHGCEAVIQSFTHEVSMTAFVDLEIAPRSGSSTTLLELLEEFADSTPTWSFLEEDSLHYSATRGTPGCVLAHIRYDSHEIVDYAFAGTRDQATGATRLVLIETDETDPEDSPDVRDQLVRDFVDAFSGYAHAVHVPIDIRFNSVDRPS